MWAMLCMGNAVGNTVGNAVGDAVGNAVGNAVGDDVGGVGDGVVFVALQTIGRFLCAAPTGWLLNSSLSLGPLVPVWLRKHPFGRSA